MQRLSQHHDSVSCMQHPFKFIQHQNITTTSLNSSRCNMKKMLPSRNQLAKDTPSNMNLNISNQTLQHLKHSTATASPPGSPAASPSTPTHDMKLKLRPTMLALPLPRRIQLSTPGDSLSSSFTYLVDGGVRALLLDASSAVTLSGAMQGKQERGSRC